MNICVKEEEQILDQTFNFEVPQPIKKEEIDDAVNNELKPINNVEEEEEEEEEEEREDVDESDEYLPSDEDESDDEYVPKRSTRKIEKNTINSKHVIDKHKVTQNHIRAPTIKRPFKREHCDKAYAKSGRLIQHSAVHGMTRYKCKHCKEVFNKRKDLHKHMADIHKIKNNSFECSHCPKIFGCRNKLENHMNIHNGTGFKCEICDKVVHSKYSYSRHCLSHTGTVIIDKTKGGYKTIKFFCIYLFILGVQEFKCKFCDKGFGSLRNKERHERIHTGDKRYVCNLCDYRDTDHSHLKRHMKTKHGSEV